MTLVAADAYRTGMAERGTDKLVWGDGEDITDYLRRVDAYVLSVGDERKAIGKALLGLGSRIGVIDSLSEDDKKSITNLKEALRREFGEMVQCNQRLFKARTKRDSETYGMFMSALRSLFQGAYAPPTPPGQSVPDDLAPVGITLIRSQFLGGVAPVVATQLRLLFPEATLEELPQHARQVEEAVGLKGQTSHLCQVDEGQSDTTQIAELRREVQSLTEAVNAIRAPVPGRGDLQQEVAGRGSGMVRGRGGRQLACWTSGEVGHLQRSCLRAPLGRGRGQAAPIVCWSCGRVGHVRNACRGHC